MKTIKGNLIDLAEQGHFNLIVHGCNCFHTMNSGIAKEIRERYPEAYEVDCRNSEKGDKNKLGTFTHYLANNGSFIDEETGFGTTGHDFLIVNGYTQYDYGYDGKQRCDYNAIRKLFRSIKSTFKDYESYCDSDGYFNITIGYPKIGCGLAGGDWEIVSKIIDEELEGMDHTYVEFDG